LQEFIFNPLTALDELTRFAVMWVLAKDKFTRPCYLLSINCFWKFLWICYRYQGL